MSEDVAAAAFSGKNEYLDWLTASNNYTILRPELFNSSGAFSSPTLTINGEYWDLKQLTAGGHEYGGRLPQVHWAGWLTR